MGEKKKDLKVILFGATGMVGSGLLQACLEDPGVKKVLVLGRNPCGKTHPKMREVLLKDLFDYKPVAGKLKGYNACLFAVGVTSVGMSEERYTHLTYDLTLTAAHTVLKANPGMGFCYVSGKGADSTEKGPVMWARVRGRLENKLLSMRFKPAVIVRPGAIVPMKGMVSKVFLYRMLYALLTPLLRVLLPFNPGTITSAERLVRAVLKAVRGEAGKTILESEDINRLGMGGA